jgi:hypothetical protein
VAVGRSQLLVEWLLSVKRPVSVELGMPRPTGTPTRSLMSRMPDRRGRAQYASPYLRMGVASRSHNSELSTVMEADVKPTDIVSVFDLLFFLNQICEITILCMCPSFEPLYSFLDFIQTWYELYAVRGPTQYCCMAYVQYVVTIRWDRLCRSGTGSTQPPEGN